MTTTSPPAITATGLRKSYGENLVLDGIDFVIPAGRIWSLLGPNGAGKTTLVQILSTLIRPDAGTVQVAGHDLQREPEAVRRAIGVTGQFAAVDELLTGEENLLLMCDLHRLSRQESRQRTAELLERFELAGDDAKKLAGAYSGGMRRKLDLAMTLVGSPRIIFLDEPTTGLDPRSRRTMWDIIRDLVADGVTIFLTTQYLEEADELADRIAVLHHGTFVAEGTPAELKRLVPGGDIRLTFDSAEQLATAAAALGVSDVDEEALSLRVPSEGDLGSMRQVIDRLDRASVTASSLSMHSPDLDDVFLTLTSQTATTGGKQEAAR
ncbi:ABC-2 type transport system ATP-binding protein [Streptomyces sp. SAI-144]|jgi:ABC-2 type transport system ATP-binding protein|uniref:ATP-binding cassette domain-containing protein n=1 Tax=unclassified Streptomyces TaxID=2593676 RepID=UPI002473E555|nr:MULTISPECIES: ATP-binding cassette domain-containing protein [unclassified Streptomyces]MDH6439247.1 ABC-2 type transport system ATP-binding protein [Streptomyces sp. SAI-144]MDH6486629.1 ABC-2 type transport system ATP-binding protein [Streptomyces sp. SAI-127]